MSTKKQAQTEEYSFLTRWSRRKQAQVAEQAEQTNKTAAVTHTTEIENPPLPTASIEEDSSPKKAAELPDVATLNADSDYTGFLDKEVDRQLRKVALRTLFKQTQFNAVDDLDIYHEDYTSFEPLGDIVTHDMRYMEEVEKRREEEKARAQAEQAEIKEHEEKTAHVVEAETEQTTISAEQEATENETIQTTKEDETDPAILVEAQQTEIKKA